VSVLVGAFTDRAADAA